MGRPATFQHKRNSRTQDEDKNKRDSNDTHTDTGGTSSSDGKSSEQKATDKDDSDKFVTEADLEKWNQGLPSSYEDVKARLTTCGRFNDLHFSKNDSNMTAYVGYEGESAPCSGPPRFTARLDSKMKDLLEGVTIAMEGTEPLQFSFDHLDNSPGKPIPGSQLIIMASGPIPISPETPITSQATFSLKIEPNQMARLKHARIDPTSLTYSSKKLEFMPSITEAFGFCWLSDEHTVKSSSPIMGVLTVKNDQGTIVDIFHVPLDFTVAAAVSVRPRFVFTTEEANNGSTTYPERPQFAFISHDDEGLEGCSWRADSPTYATATPDLYTKLQEELPEMRQDVLEWRATQGVSEVDIQNAVQGALVQQSVEKMEQNKKRSLQGETAYEGQGSGGEGSSTQRTTGSGPAEMAAKMRAKRVARRGDA